VEFLKRRLGVAYLDCLLQRPASHVAASYASLICRHEDDHLVLGLVLDPEPAKDVAFSLLEHGVELPDGILLPQPPDRFIQRHALGLSVGLSVTPQGIAHRRSSATLGRAGGQDGQQHQ